MEEQMRSTGIEVIGNAPWGTHLCQFYQNEQDLIDILVPYFRQGLDDNEFCMWITSEPLGVDEAREALRSVESEFDNYIRKGQIEILDYTQWYTRTGRFNADEVLKGWVEKLEGALDRNYEGLRLSGNTFWLENKDWVEFTAYEEAVNRLIGKYPILALCTYSLDKCSAHEIMDVMINHRFALVKRAGRWQMIESSEHQKTEAALRESEESLKRAQELAQLGSWTLDVGKNRLTWSDEVYKIFGLQPQEFSATYEAFLEHVHPDDRAAVETAYSGSIRDGKNICETDHRILQNDTGQIRYVHEKCEHVRDETGRVIRSIGMVHDITERKLAEERTTRQNAVLSGIARIFRETLTCQTEEELGRVCLAVAEEVTQSQFGFIGEINRETGKLEDIAISDPGWGLCRVRNQSGHGKRVPIGFAIHGIYGRVLLDGKGIFTNDPPSHPYSIGVPAGHPALKAFLGVPLIHAERTIGMVGLGNREGGYGPKEVEAIEALAPAIVQAFISKRAEGALCAARYELEIKVKERTAELQQITERLKAENQERIRTEQSLRLEEARLDALLHLSRISEAPLKEIAGFTLEQAILLTNSKIGFVGLVNEDQTVYTLHAVSKDVVRECHVTGDPLQWHIADAGIWADAIREHKTLFVNDYSKPHPRKKGIPSGHPYVERLMVVPILGAERVVAVAGVGNKASDYDKSDERQVVLLLSGMWGYMQKNRSRKDLQKTHHELKKTDAKLKEHNRRLEGLNKELQDFAFIASHDLQEPLRKVRTFGDLLAAKCGASLDESSRDYLRRMQAAAARMQNLINSFLAYSRVTTKTEPIEETDLRKSVEVALSNLEVMIKEKNARVEVGELPWLRADRVQMSQLFQNLIENALKYSRGGQTPYVKVYAPGGDEDKVHEICVEDKGIGFDERYLDRIFLPFQRLHGKSDYEGVGMGLAICKKIVERHGGKITARSELGKGSTFIVTLPAER